MSDTTATTSTAGTGAANSSTDTTTSTATAGGNTATTTAPITLPDDHPLVTTLAANKTEIAGLKTAKTAAETAASKATEDLTTVTGERDTATQRAACLELALTHGLGLDDVDVLADVTDPAKRESLAKRLAAGGTSTGTASDTRTTTRVPGEGTTTKSAGEDPMRTFARGLFQRGD